MAGLASVALALGLLGLLLVVLAVRGRWKRGLGQGETVALDDVTFFSERLKLTGRPDRIIKRGKTFIPEEGKIGSNIARTRSGLGVTRVDTLTLRTTDVEPPRNGASDYLSDGRGNVRLMELQETEQGRITGRYKYLYRTSGSREWKQLTPFQTRDLVPLAHQSVGRVGADEPGSTRDEHPHRRPPRVAWTSR